MTTKRWCLVRLKSNAWALLLGICCCFLSVASASAQLWEVPPLPTVTVTPAADGMTATVGPESLHISVCRSTVIHFVATPEPPDKVKPNQPWMLDSKESCPGAKFQLSQTADVATLTTDTLKVELSLKRGNVQYSITNGEALLRERDSIPRTYDLVELNSEKTFHIEDRFAPDMTEGFYGLGQHQSGMFNYRGATVQLAQNNTDVAIPLLLSSKGYGLMWSTASLTYVDNRFPLELNLSSLAGHSIDYYFMLGPEIDQVIHQYRNLTGHTPMLPQWSYGFFQSKDRYLSQEEVLGIAHRYREQRIPLDAIVQDWFWWKAEGDPVFNPNFPVRACRAHVAAPPSLPSIREISHVHRLSRRQFLRFSTGAGAGLMLGALPGSASERRPPNVVMIVGDDQGYTDFAFMGHDVIRTPRSLDRLAGESAVFPKGYVPASLCRASLACCSPVCIRTSTASAATIHLQESYVRRAPGQGQHCPTRQGNDRPIRHDTG